MTPVQSYVGDLGWKGNYTYKNCGVSHKLDGQ